MPEQQTMSQRPGGVVKTLHVVEKVWGRELWLQADGGIADGYCGKVLEIAPGASGSKHWHREKHETWLVLDGAVRVEYDGGTGHRCETLRQGAVLSLPPATWHRMTGLAPSGARIMEVSTPHADDDVVRMEPSRPAKRSETPRG